MKKNEYTVGIFENQRLPTSPFLIAGTKDSMFPYLSAPWKIIAEPISAGRDIGSLAASLTELDGAVIPPHPRAQNVYVGASNDLIMAKLQPDRVYDVCEWLSGMYGQKIEPKA